MVNGKVEVPERVKKRLIANVPKFQKILRDASKAGENETTTEMIIADALEEIFGFQKIKEICFRRPAYDRGKKREVDMVIKLEGEIHYCIEVKSVRQSLADSHVNQAEEWANAAEVSKLVVTNGVAWQVRSINKKESSKSILVSEFDLTTINPKKESDQQKLFMLCKKGAKQDLIKKAAQYKGVMNPHVIGAVLQNSSLLVEVRKNMKKLSPGFKVSIDEIQNMIVEKILRPDIVEGESAEAAKKKVRKALGK